jgi:hypothetical protein
MQFGPVDRLHGAPSLAAAWQMPSSAQTPRAAQSVVPPLATPHA